ncbi:MAG: class I SAM-dependent methyltransferase [Candidatus Brocadiales bacterium]|nr:class I SAM-dependent methyltransferase [Candidatus Bathyanammoxibius sp.]
MGITGSDGLGIALPGSSIVISAHGANRIGTRPCPDCYVCGLPGQPLYSDLQDRHFGAPGKWNLKKCPDPDCGLIWLDPMPTEEDIGRAYEHYYTHNVDTGDQFLQSSSFSIRLYLIKKSPLRPLLLFLRQGYFASTFGYAPGTPLWQRLVSYGLYLFPREVRRLAQQLRYAHFVPGGKLLDVGCGDGTFLAQMRDLGWEVEGVEVDPLAVEQVRKLNLPVHCGSLEQRSFENNRFDVVSMNHVIEHIYNPLEVLKECYRILKPGGMLIAITPNTRSATHRKFKESCFHLDPPRHIHLFTSPALKNLASKAGFVVQMRTSAVGASWVYIESELFARNHQSLKTCPQLFLSFKTLIFDLYESCLILRGKDSGEEIILQGVKQ